MNWMESFQDKPHLHRRHFLSVQGDYFAITDEAQCDYPSDYALQILAEHAEAHGEAVHCTGSFDVDLDVHVLAPTGVPVDITRTRLITGKEQLLHPLPMVRLHLSAPANQPYFTLLAPYVRGEEPPPRVERLDAPFAAHITRGEQEDYLFLAPSALHWQSGTYQFQGTRGLLRIHPRLELLLLDTGTLSAGAVSLQSTAGGLLLSAQPDGSWHGQCSGEAKTVTLNGISVTAISCDEQPLEWKTTSDGVTFALPAGEHQLCFR